MALESEIDLGPDLGLTAPTNRELFVKNNEDKGSTGLSERVRLLISLCVPKIDIVRARSLKVDFKKLFLREGLLSFDKCAELLPNHEHASCYYEESVSILAPVFKQCEDNLIVLSSEDFICRFGQYLAWTNKLNLFVDCFELLMRRRGDDNILALLLITGTLERALGNVYLLRGSQCPAMLKELLVTEQLLNILGLSAIQVLQLVMGPPISLNLRNIAWHGFLSENELPERCVFFMLMVTASLGKLLEEKGIMVADIPAREYVSLSSVEGIKQHLTELSASQLETLQACVMSSWLVNDTNNNLFQSVFKFYKEKRFGWCVVLLFPLLEHGLRRLFVTVNQCPDRLRTAEASVLFTTYEEILDCRLSSGKENEVTNVLGEHCMDFLHDLLIYPNGPRARDKLGHGEVDYSQVPKSLADVTLQLVGFLAMKSQQVEEMAPLMEPFTHYRSVFHPVEMLRCKILEVSQKESQLFEDVRTTPGLESWAPDDGMESFIVNNPIFTQAQTLLQQFECIISTHVPSKCSNGSKESSQRLKKPFGDVHKVSEALTKFRISTLYRWQRGGNVSTTPQMLESELVGLLTRILSEAEQCLQHSREAVSLRQEQLAKKLLRSRQRDNMKRLLLFLPCSSLFANHVGALTTWIFCHLDTYATCTDSACKALQKFLKGTLQTCENMKVFSSLDKNKWTEAGEAIVSLLQASLEFSQKSFFPPLPAASGAEV